MFGVSKILNKYINAIFSKDVLNCSKVTVKTFIMLQKISFSNKYCSFELTMHKNNPEGKRIIMLSRK